VDLADETLLRELDDDEEVKTVKTVVNYMKADTNHLVLTLGQLEQERPITTGNNGKRIIINLVLCEHF
jgi:hypothetical protein